MPLLQHRGPSADDRQCASNCSQGYGGHGIGAGDIWQGNALDEEAGLM